MKISIVTATYNRSSLLERLFQSILENSKAYSNIEWLIMDDGSKEDIKRTVSHFMEQADFPIFFYKQKNGGKMAAINQLIPKVTGDIIIEMDDDDYFVSNCFSLIAKDYETIKYQDDIYGIIYEKDLGKESGTIPSQLSGKVMRLYDLHYKKKQDFDMALTFKADYRKQFYYELEADERFITEARMYYKMDQKKRGFLIRDEQIMICQYQEAGYSRNIEKMFQKYPHGYYAFFQEVFSYPQRHILFSKRLYNVKHFILFGYLCHQHFFEMVKYPKGWNKILFTILYFPGRMMSRKRFGENYEEENSN